MLWVYAARVAQGSNDDLGNVLFLVAPYLIHVGCFVERDAVRNDIGRMKVGLSVSNHKDLETAVNGADLQRRAVNGGIIELGTVDDAGEIDFAIRRVDGERARVLARRQNLDNRVSVCDVLAYNGQASGVASVRSEDETVIGVVTDGVCPDADRK